MKIEMELRDRPGGRAPVKVTVDGRIHPSLHLKTLVSAAIKHHPWVKVIDIRIELHGGRP